MSGRGARLFGAHWCLIISTKRLPTGKKIFVSLKLCVWKVGIFTMYIPIRRRLLCTLVVLGHPFNGILVALPKGCAQLFVVPALAPWIDRVSPGVLAVRQLVQDNTHGPDVDRSAILLLLDLRGEIIDRTAMAWRGL